MNEKKPGFQNSVVEKPGNEVVRYFNTLRKITASLFTVFQSTTAQRLTQAKIYYSLIDKNFNE